jgi:hypothetical protein
MCRKIPSGTETMGCAVSSSLELSVSSGSFVYLDLATKKDARVGLYSYTKFAWQVLAMFSIRAVTVASSDELSEPIPCLRQQSQIIVGAYSFFSCVRIIARLSTRKRYPVVGLNTGVRTMALLALTRQFGC